MADLHCRITLRIADTTRGPWGLPSVDEVWAGRGAGSGLWIPEEWVPRALCRLLPTAHGWLLQNGSRARVRVQNPYVGDTHFAPKALVALQEGKTLASWPDLDDICQLGAEIGEGVAEGLERLENGRPPRDVDARTDYAVHSLSVTPEHRVMLAVLFAHLIRGGPKPANLAQAAGKRLGRSEQAIKNQANDLRHRLNEQRWLNLRDTDQMGHYLVVTTRTISWADLPEGYLGNPD